MNTFREGKSLGNVKSRPGHNGPPTFPKPPPPPAPRKAVPFNPPTGEEIHEYRVLVHDGYGVTFTTTWFIESHALAVYNSLIAAYRTGTVRLQRRMMAGYVENL